MTCKPPPPIPDERAACRRWLELTGELTPENERRLYARALTLRLLRDLDLVRRDLCKFIDDNLLDLVPLPEPRFDRLFSEVLRAEWQLASEEGQP
jgi:hypothetical protein